MWSKNVQATGCSSRVTKDGSKQLQAKDVTEGYFECKTCPTKACALSKKKKYIFKPLHYILCYLGWLTAQQVKLSAVIIF